MDEEQIEKRMSDLIKWSCVPLDDLREALWRFFFGSNPTDEQKALVDKVILTNGHIQTSEDGRQTIVCPTKPDEIA